MRARSGRPYKPATVRSYRRAFRLRLLPAFGTHRLGDLRRRDVQALIDRMAADGLDGSTIRNAIDPLRVVFRRAITRELVTVNPMVALDIPAGTGTRDRIASPDEAATLIAALPEGDRAVWATAMYAGLRRGELRALRWEDVDLAGGVIRVQRGWDAKEGPIYRHAPRGALHGGNPQPAQVETGRSDAFAAMIRRQRSGEWQHGEEVPRCDQGAPPSRLA